MADQEKFSNPMFTDDGAERSLQNSPVGSTHFTFGRHRRSESVDGGFDSSIIFDKLREDEESHDVVGAARLPEFVEASPIMKALTFAISPLRTERLVWDAGMLALVVYSSVSVPYRLAFRVDVNESLSTWETFVDAMFWADIVLSFFTGYDKGYEVVMEKGKIVRHYLTGWFIIDLAATIQWDTAFKAVESADSEPVVVLRIKLLRLLKVLRLLRLGRLVNRLTQNMQLNSAYIDALKFFFYVFVMAHLLACFFYLIPIAIVCEEGEAADSRFDASLSLWSQGSAAEVAMQCSLDPDNCDGTTASGWYHPGTCMQGSWRQDYGLEQVCLEPELTPGELSEKLVQCQKMRELGLKPWDAAVVDLGTKTVKKTNEVPLKDEWGTSDKASSNYDTRLRDMQELFAEHIADNATAELFVAPEPCQLCMDPWRLYIDAMYWSLTTMTTIGYGDRGPKSENEIVFTMVAEVFGLAVFALLLDNVVKLADAVAEETQKRKDEKNLVVEFLSSQNLSPKLIKEAVRFLNFRATSMSGRSFNPEAPEFAMLSQGLKQSIQHEMYKPVLERVHFFGHNPEDRLENERCLAEFKYIDNMNENNNQLDKDEMRSFLESLKVTISDENYDLVFNELDRHNTGYISYEEFHRWWFLKKTGRPQGLPAPDAFMDALCTKLQAQAYAPLEQMIEMGDCEQPRNPTPSFLEPFF
jgi:hypothetical protein